MYILYVMMHVHDDAFRSVQLARPQPGDRVANTVHLRLEAENGKADTAGIEVAVRFRFRCAIQPEICKPCTVQWRQEEA